MSHPNIGTIMDVLNIKTPEDFFALNDKDRVEFCSLVKTSAECNSQEILKSTSRDVGFKMHFRIKRRRGSRNGWQNIPNYTFMRKVGFFASRTVISFPFNDCNFRKDGDIQPFLEMLCAARPFIKADMVRIIPSTCTNGFFTQARFDKKYRLTSANFESNDLETQFEENLYPTQVANLYLPYFHPLEPEDIIRLRGDEKYLYDGLEQRLGMMFRGLDSSETEEKLLREMEAISGEVRRLTEKYKALQEAYSRRDIYTIVGFAAAKLVVLLAAPGIPVLAAPAAALGDIKTISDFCQYRIEKAWKEQEARVEGYYLFWQLDKLCSSEETSTRRREDRTALSRGARSSERFSQWWKRR